MNIQIAHILKNGESVIESCDQVIFRKKQGILLISNTRLLWFKLDNATSISMSTFLSVPMSKIKSVQSSLPNQRFTLLRIGLLSEPIEASSPSKDTSPVSVPSTESVVIFRFIGDSCEKDRDAIKSIIFQFISDRRKIRELSPSSTDASSPAISKSSEKKNAGNQINLSSKSREKSILSLEVDPHHKSILKQHDYIYMLYTEFVGLGIVSSEEFWSMNEDWVRWEEERFQGSGESTEKDRSSSLSEQVVAAEEVTLPSLFIDKLKSSLRKGRLRLTLTPLLVQEIFFEFPSVEKAYQSKVPLEMSHVDFWNRFFKSQVSKLQCMDLLAPLCNAQKSQDVNGSPREGKKEYVVDDTTFSLFPASSSEKASGALPRGDRMWIDPRQVDIEFAMLTNYEGTQSYIEERLMMKKKAVEARRKEGANLEEAKGHESSDLERLQTELGLDQSTYRKVGRSEDVLDNRIDLDEEVEPNPQLEEAKKRSVYLQLIRKFNRYGDLVVAHIQATKEGTEEGESDRSMSDRQSISTRAIQKGCFQKFNHLGKSVDKWKQSELVPWVDLCTKITPLVHDEPEIDWISVEGQLIEKWRNWHIPHVLASNIVSLHLPMPSSPLKIQKDPFQSQDFLFCLERSFLWRQCFWSFLSSWLSHRSSDLEEKLKKIRIHLNMCYEMGLRLQPDLPEDSVQKWQRIYLSPIERAISIHEKVFR